MNLDDAQADIVAQVSARRGCLLVTGGPGSGKTTALVASVAALVDGGVPLDEIVVLAHARPAAQRLRRQAMAAIGTTQAGPRITTAHGWCRWLMGAYAAPEVSQPRLLSAPEQEFRIAELLGAVEWPPELQAATGSPAFAGQVRALLTRARQLGLDPSGLAEAGLAAGRDDWVAAAKFFEVYLDVIDHEGVLDYAELVHRSRLLMLDDDVRAGLPAHTKAVLVDDFAEYDESLVALLRDIWRAGVPVTAFGDATTRILGFRGAWAGALARFADEFAGASGPAPVVELTANHRQADQAEAWLAATPGDEPALLAQRLWLAHADGVAWQQMAVIGRADGSELSHLAAALAAAGVPVRLEGEALALAEVPAVRLIMDGLWLVVARARQQDTPEQWLGVLSSPLVGLDAADLRQLARLLDDAPAEDWAGALVAALLSGDGLPLAEDAALLATGERLAAVVHAIDGLARGIGDASFSELAWGVWTLGDWPQQLRQASLDRATGALRADRDLDAVIALFDLAGGRPQARGAGGVEAMAALVRQQVVRRDRAREAEDPAGVVTVLSAYRAKGRGWPVVAVCGAVEGTWPVRGTTWSLLEPDRLYAGGQLPPATRGEMVGAQRRLFALATSRASSHLIVTGAPEASGEPAQLSRFVAEMGLEAAHWQAGALQRGGIVSPRELVGQLRAAATSAHEPPGVADSAAALLGQLADQRRADGRPLAPDADPRRWWWVGGPSVGHLADGPVRLSASNIHQLLACPRSWFLQTQAGASPPMGDAAWFGQLAHWLFQMCAVDTPPRAVIEEELRVRFGDTPLQQGWRQAALYQSLLDSLDRFEVWRDGRPGRRLLGAETSFTQLWQTDEGPVEVRGRVDRLETNDTGQLVVIDFKTSASRKPSLYDDQLGIYAIAAGRGAFSSTGAPGEAAGVAPPELVWTNVPLRAADVGCLVDEATAQVMDQQVVFDRLAQAVAIVRSERYPATPAADTCRNCVFSAGCPASVTAVAA